MQTRVERFVELLDVPQMKECLALLISEMSDLDVIDVLKESVTSDTVKDELAASWS